MPTLLLGLIGPMLFFIAKAANLAVRFSDTNVYFYTAKELLTGKVLYKDIFFTNLPLFPYISAMYELIMGKSMELYYLTATLEVIVTGLLLFFIAWKKTNRLFVSMLIQWTYLFSFIILSTSDYQTGVFLASLFSIFAYLVAEKKQWFLTGILLGLMTLTKAYYVSITAAFLLFYFIKNKRQFFMILTGFIVTVGIILAPFVLFSGKKFFKDIVSYSLFRSSGVDKLTVFEFFFRHDPVLGAIAAFIISRMRKNMLLGLVVLLSGILLVFYKDVYYLYLNLVAPFLIIGLIDYFIVLKNKGVTVLLIGVIGLLLLVNGYVYYSHYAELGKISGISGLVSVIKREKPDSLYGVMEIAPALAYLSKVPLMAGIIDTNENLFNNRVLNAVALTKQALSDRTIVVGKGAYYPENNIDDPLATIVVNKSQIFPRCTLLYKTPVQTEGIINEITIFKCYK